MRSRWVQDVGHYQGWASFLSQRETVKFIAWKRIMGVAETWKKAQGTCAEDRSLPSRLMGGKRFADQRSASFQEDDELHLLWGLPDNDIRDLIGSHTQLSPSHFPGSTSHTKQREQIEKHPLLPHLFPPPALTLLECKIYTYPALFNTHIGREIITRHWKTN